jgi:hypothetical protein
MKNKKIFGLIHYFDLIVVLVIIGLAILGGSMVFQSDDLQVSVLNTNKTYAVEFLLSGVRKATYNNINPGELFYVSETNKAIGRVKSIDVIDHELISINSKGEIIKAVHPSKKDVYLTIEGSGSKNGSNITMGNKVIKIGNLMEMYNDLVETTPVIYGIEEVEN